MKVRKKIAFVIPNFAWQEADKSVLWHVVPYNICLLAAIVRDLCDIVIIDANTDNLDYTGFKNALIQSEANVIGITVMMDQFAKSGHLAAKLAREVLPNSVIISRREIIWRVIYVIVKQKQLSKQKKKFG